MMPTRVDEMLAQYKVYAGRCEYLELQIENYQKQIEKMKRDMAEELAYASGKSEDGMPRGTTVGNPTERIGIMLASDYELPDVMAYQKAVKQMEDEYREKHLVVCFVRTWLNALTEKERWMIEGKVFNEKTYREMSLEYQRIYGDGCSRDKLREIRKSAMTKIYGMAE